MNYIQPDQFYSTEYFQFHISDEQEFYDLWEAQRGNQFWTEEGFYRILSTGIRNFYSGPDYYGASVQTPNGKTIHGDIEIHSEVNNWYRHNHHLDASFEKVILHVVVKGQCRSVKSLSGQRIPTIKMEAPQFLRKVKPCNNLVQSLSIENFYNWIHLFSIQRWEYLQSYFKQGSNAVRQRILSFMDIKSNPGAVEKTIAYYFSLSSTIPYTKRAKMVEIFAKKLSWKMGRKRPASHPLKRLPLLLYISENYKVLIKQLPAPSQTTFYRYLQLNLEPSIALPGRQYLTEIFGNIILPLYQVQQLGDYYPIWLQLPVTPYGSVKRHLQTMGFPNSINFGIQQGLLELNRQLCSNDLCRFCPLTQNSDRSNN